MKAPDAKNFICSDEKFELDNNGYMVFLLKQSIGEDHWYCELSSSLKASYSVFAATNKFKGLVPLVLTSYFRFSFELHSHGTTHDTR